MDGSIELKSKAGVGTTVIVKIPFKIGTQDKNSNLSDKPVSLMIIQWKACGHWLWKTMN